MTNYYINGPQPPEDDEGICRICGGESDYLPVCTKCIRRAVRTVCDELGLNENEIVNEIEISAKIEESNRWARSLLRKYKGAKNANAV